MAMSATQSDPNRECRLLIVGVGNGAGCALAEIARQWPERPAMAVVNTEAPGEVEGVRCVQIGTQVMKGMGSGGDPRVGRRAAEADVGAVRELFHDANLVFLVVGLGGGTGTGAAPLVAEEARKAGALVLCFAMLPFEFEGRRRMEHAQHGLLALKDVADGVICLPNQRLLDLVEDRTNIAEAFRKADALLGRGIQAVWRVICRKGVINLDFADMRALLQEGSGQCVFSCAEGTGRDKIGMALKALQADPLLKRGQVLAEAHSYIVSIAGGTDLTLKDVDRLMQGMAEFCRAEALAMTGVSCDPALQDRVFVTILAAERAAEPGAQDRPRSVPDAGAKPPDFSGTDEGMGTLGSQKKKLTQGKLFDEAGQGRFKDVDPTIVEGNNLDIPTFIRRGIMIQKVR